MQQPWNQELSPETQAGAQHARRDRRRTGESPRVPRSVHTVILSAQNSSPLHSPHQILLLVQDLAVGLPAGDVSPVIPTRLGPLVERIISTSYDWSNYKPVCILFLSCLSPHHTGWEMRAKVSNVLLPRAWHAEKLHKYLFNE